MKIRAAAMEMQRGKTIRRPNDEPYTYRLDGRHVVDAGDPDHLTLLVTDLLADDWEVVPE